MVTIAALALLGAVELNVVQTPAASAQTPFYPYSLYNYGLFGNPTSGYGYGFPSYGYNLYSNGYYGYGGYPYYSYYGYNPYSYGYSGYSGYGGYNGSLGYNGYLGYTSYTPFYGTGYGGGTVYAPAVVSTTTPSIAYVSGQRVYATTGQYCTDKSGGQVWVPAGAPTQDLTCGGSSTATPY